MAAIASLNAAQLSATRSLGGARVRRSTYNAATAPNKPRRTALKVDALGASGRGGWGVAREESNGLTRRRFSARTRRTDVVVPSSTGDAAAAPSPEGSSGGSSPAPSPKLDPLATFVRGCRRRLAADPNFPFKICAEVGLDEVITAVVNIGVRGNPLMWDIGEKLQVICQMLTAGINDVILVYCLAPVKMEDGSAGSVPAKQDLAHMFQEGDYSLGERLMCWVNKAKFYASVGGISCMISTYLALLCSGQTNLICKDYLLRALATGALHFGLSANTRYQCVNGIERVLYKILPQNVARGSSVLLRLGNNFLGARLWMVMASVTGWAAAG